MDPNKPISAIMTTQLITLDINDPLRRAKEIFEQNDFHHIPVLQKGESLVGIISREDWLRRLKSKSVNTEGKTWTEFEYASLTAGDIMTPHPMALDTEDTIGLAADIFLANKFHALPIVEDGQLVGMITSHDLLQYAFSHILTR